MKCPDCGSSSVQVVGASFLPPEKMSKVEVFCSVCQTKKNIFTDLGSEESKKRQRREDWALFLARESAGTIECPRCALAYGSQQPLSQLGDWPETLFCPGCDIEITFNIRYFGRDKL